MVKNFGCELASSVFPHPRSLSQREREAKSFSLREKGWDEGTHPKYPDQTCAAVRNIFQHLATATRNKKPAKKRAFFNATQTAN